MKKTITLIAILAFLSHSLSIQAQVKKDKILAETNVDALIKLAAELSSEYKARYAAAMKQAKIKGWDTVNLTGLDEDGFPIYNASTNDDAAALSKTIQARASLNSTGSGMVVGMWEAFEPGTSAYPLNGHQDFSNGSGGDRIDFEDTNNPGTASSHATHVAGTLIGSPPASAGNASRGMAPAASLKSYNSTIDLAEMTSEAAAGMLISNHSYGTIDGWERNGFTNLVFDNPVPLLPDITVTVPAWEWRASNWNTNPDPDFGRYDSQSRSVDQICQNAPFYLPVWAAGNDQNNNPIQNSGTASDPSHAVRQGQSGSYVQYNASIHPPQDQSNSCTVADKALALNVLTVGSMTKTGGISNFSSRGITNDNRVMPHLCGTGQDLYSAWNTGNASYSSISGTSMATPNVAGSLLILQDGYRKLHGSTGAYMRSATLKGLAIHTALDIGPSGPDATFGWGRLDAEKASEVIEDDAWKTSSSKHKIIEDVFTGTTKTYYVKTTSADPLLVTLCYTDPVNTNSLVPLQNDLDLRVKLPSNTTLFPQKVGGTTGDDDADVVERVKLVSNQNGTTTITVSLEGSLYQGNPQPFSLIISGLNPTCHINIEQDRNITIQSGDYNAQSSITSAATLASNADIVFKRGGAVRLTPGFHAKRGTTFETLKGTCN